MRAVRVRGGDDAQAPVGQQTSVPTGYGITMRRNTPTTAGSNARPSPSAITRTPTCARLGARYGRWLVIAS